MKVYIAASIVEVEEVRKVRDVLFSNGIRVNSRWIDIDYSQSNTDPLDDAARCFSAAQDDCEDIDMADCILFLRGNSKSAGKTTELGYCIANKKVVFFVGTPYSVFHFAKNIIHFDNVEEAIKSLLLSRRIIEAIA